MTLYQVCVRIALLLSVLVVGLIAPWWCTLIIIAGLVLFNAVSIEIIITTLVLDGITGTHWYMLVYTASTLGIYILLHTLRAHVVRR